MSNIENHLENQKINQKQKKHVFLDHVFPNEFLVLILFLIVLVFQLYSGMRIVKIDFEKAAVIKGIRNLDMEKKEFYKNKKEIDEVMLQINQLKAEVEQLKNQKIIIGEEIIRTNKTKEELSREIVGLEGEFKNNQEKVGLVQKQNDRLSVESSKLQNTKDGLESGVNNLRIEKENLNNEVNELTIKLDKTRSDQSALNDQLLDISDKVQKGKIELEQIEGSFKVTREELVHKLQDLIDKTGSMHTDYAKVIDDMKNSSSQFNQGIIEPVKGDVAQFAIVKDQLNSLTQNLKDILSQLTSSSKDMEIRKSELLDRVKKVEENLKTVESKIDELKGVVLKINRAK